MTAADSGTPGAALDGPSGGFSRRKLLLGAAGAGALAAFGPARTQTAAAVGGSPGLPSQDQVWDWQHQLVDFGTRYTGSPGHDRFVDWISNQLTRIPGFRLRTDRHTFGRWLAHDWSLSIRQPATAGRSGPVPLAYYYPYSGRTPAQGVTGRLVDLGTYPAAVVGTSGTGLSPEFWLPARGGIALVRAAPSTFSLAPVSPALGGYERGKTSQQAAADYAADTALQTNPAYVGIFAPVGLRDAKAAGVKAVIVAYTGMPDDEVAHQYNPFITPYPSASGVPAPADPGCPAVWVGDGTGRDLSRAARTGAATATVRLTADITAGAATETVWGFLPGSKPGARPLIVNTHTDGPNATEENGALGLLALAQHFARRPHARDIYFVFVTGHFQLPQFTRPIPTPRPEVGSDATSVWMADHPAIYRAAVAGLTVEHLGCMQWVGDPSTNRYVATGRSDWGITYTCRRTASTSPTNTEQATWLAAVRAVAGAGRTVGRVAAVQPAPLYLGEGAPLYAGGLGTVSLIPLPTYLLQAGSTQRPKLLDLEKLDKHLAYGQILAFARTLAALDARPDSAF
jgi:hypothetical protein